MQSASQQASHPANQQASQQARIPAKQIVLFFRCCASLAYHSSPPSAPSSDLPLTGAALRKDATGGGLRASPDPPGFTLGGSSPNTPPICRPPASVFFGYLLDVPSSQIVIQPASQQASQPAKQQASRQARITAKQIVLFFRCCCASLAYHLSPPSALFSKYWCGSTKRRNWGGLPAPPDPPGFTWGGCRPPTPAQYVGLRPPVFSDI